MAAVRGISWMFRIITRNNWATCKTRRLYVCDKHVLAFVKLSKYEAHILWCNGGILVNSKVSLNTFEPHINNIESLPFTIYYDLETTSYSEDMEVTSYPYAVTFDSKLKFEPFVRFRSYNDIYESLCSINGLHPSIHDMLTDDDHHKMMICAKDIVSGTKKHVLTQMLMFGIYIIQRVIQGRMTMLCHKNSYLHPKDVDRSMINVNQQKCYLESVTFYLWKLFMELYCQSVEHHLVTIREVKFVTLWLVHLSHFGWCT